MAKATEMMYLDVIDAEVNQIAICLNGIHTFLGVLKEEAKNREDEKGGSEKIK